MPPVCSLCRHPDRAAIDRALLAGDPLRNIAERFGTSPATLLRHREHLPVRLVTAHEVAQVAQADDLLQQVRDLRADALRLLRKAEHAGDYRTALAGVKEARTCIEVLLEVEGELDRRSVTNILVNPQWIEVRAALVTALTPHPDALQAVTAALAALEHSA